mgnify:CR=1 FL=1
MKKLLDVCSLFMAIIGSCAAVMVCYILFIYPNLNDKDLSNNKDTIISSQNINSTPEGISSNFNENEILPPLDGTQMETSPPETESNINSVPSKTYNIDEKESYVNPQAGEFEEVSAPSPTVSPESSEPNAIYSYDIPVENVNQTANNFVSAENGDNFNTYDNSVQQQIDDSYVLDNTPVQNEGTQDSYENNFDTNNTSDSQDTIPVGDTVWLSATGSHYHNKNDCGSMDSTKARQVSLDYALSEGYDHCKKCFPN